ncbi:MAG: hypothetical protein ACK456_16265 [Pseudanabaenaceae cyanobacterium]|jgi:hypothetical protein
MKADLEELVISNNDIHALTGMDTFDFIAFPNLKQIAISTIKNKIRYDQRFSKKWNNLSEVEKQRDIENFRSLMIAVLLLTPSITIVLPFYLLRAIIVIITNRSLKKIIRLIKEVTNHNQIVKNLHTLDQLVEAGNPIKLNDRGTVIDALRITRAGLVRALKTEKILRENPKFMPEYFNIDLTTIESEKTTVRAVEYAELLNDALQVGVSVQQAMRKLKDSY